LVGTSNYTIEGMIDSLHCKVLEDNIKSKPKVSKQVIQRYATLQFNNGDQKITHMNYIDMVLLKNKIIIAKS